MIQLRTIHIEDFRGVRNLDLELNAKNFGICGPNGTGKSGLVDAIEFCLTGDVTRLSGRGSADVSVKDHAPHVDQKTHPEKAQVTIKVNIPSLNKTATINRSVKNPQKVKITPDDADVKGIIEELETHPEFALSRREIVKYIITPAGKRAEDVQTLLRLEHIDKLRKVLTTFSNKRSTEDQTAERLRIAAEKDLKNWLKTDQLTRPFVLQKVNGKRRALGLQELTELTKETSFKAGIAAPKPKEQKPALRKTVALSGITGLQSAIAGGEPPDLIEHRRSAKTSLEKLRDDEKALARARQHGFIKTGLDLITEDACPLCDTAWKADELREHLRQKLLRAEEIGKLLQQLRNDINPILASLATRIQAVEALIQYSQLLKPPIGLAESQAYLE